MRTITNRSSLVVAIVAAGTLMFAACGGGDSGSSPAENDTVDVTDTSLDVQEQLDAAKDVDDAIGSNCAEAATAFGAVAMSASQAVTNPGAFSIDEMKKNIEIARTAVPGELADEFDLYAEMYLAYGEVIADIGGVEGLADPQNAAKFAELQDKIDDDEISAAGEAITTYFANQCTFPGAG